VCVPGTVLCFTIYHGFWCTCGQVAWVDIHLHGSFCQQLRPFIHIGQSYFQVRPNKLIRLFYTITWNSTLVITCSCMFDTLQQWKWPIHVYERNMQVYFDILTFLAMKHSIVWKHVPKLFWLQLYKCNQQCLAIPLLLITLLICRKVKQFNKKNEAKWTRIHPIAAPKMGFSATPFLKSQMESQASPWVISTLPSNLQVIT